MIVHRTFVMNAAATEPDVGCQVLLELLYLWVWPKTVHVIHVHLLPHLTVWIPEKLWCAHAFRETQLVYRSRREMINPSLTSLASARQLFLQLPPNVYAHASCPQAIQVLFRWFYHHIIQLRSLMKSIRAIQSESRHTTCERENVHNSSSAVLFHRKARTGANSLEIRIRTSSSPFFLYDSNFWCPCECAVAFVPTNSISQCCGFPTMMTNIHFNETCEQVDANRSYLGLGRKTNRTDCQSGSQPCNGESNHHTSDFRVVPCSNGEKAARVNGNHPLCNVARCVAFC